MPSPPAAAQLQVFIAHPQDAEPYLPLVERAIETWNEILEDQLNARLTPRRWRMDLEPLYRQGRVQTVINERLVDPAHIVVALFSKRLGVGTVEEIKRSQQPRDKRILIYKDDAAPESELQRYLARLHACNILPITFSRDSLGLIVFRDLQRTVGMMVGPPDIVAFTAGEQRLYSVRSVLADVRAGDRVVIVGRTCLSWLGDNESRAALVKTVLGGVTVSFVIQDLYDKLADPQFANLRDDHAAAVQGYEELRAQIASRDVGRLGSLTLKYSLGPIQHSRTVVYRQDRMRLLRYDLTMQKGHKPFVAIRSEELARPILRDTAQLERHALTPEDFRSLQRARVPEEPFRTAAVNARHNYAFASSMRGNAPLRLVRPSARVRLALANDQPTPPPISVQLLLHRGCSTHCAMCTYFERQDPGQLTVEDFKHLTDDISRMGTRSVILSGGEPLLLRGVEEVLTHAFAVGNLKIGLLTSGVLGEGKKKSLLDVVASCCAWVQVSVDSFEKETYSQIRVVGRPREGALRSCREFLEGHRARGVRDIEVCYTIQRKNIDELTDTAGLRKKMDEVVPSGIPVRFKFATGRGDSRPGSEAFLPTEQQLSRLHHAWTVATIGGGAGRTVNAEFVRTALDDHRKIAAVAAGYPARPQLKVLADAGAPCRVMRHTAFIDCNGDVYPCCYLFNDNAPEWPHRQQFRIGNWKAQKSAQVQASVQAPHPDVERHEPNALLDIWTGSEFERRRRMTLDELPREACGRCTRHMQQNDYLQAMEMALDQILAEGHPERLARALEVFEDPSDPKSPPMWL